MTRKLNGANGGSLIADPFFATLHLVMGAREWHDARLVDRVAGEDGVAMDAQGVVSPHLLLDAAALAEIEVGGDEEVVHLEDSRELLGDVAIAGAGHAEIGFGDEQDVSRRNEGMIFQEVDDFFETDAAFHIPGHGPVIGFRYGRGGDGFHLITV